MSHQFSSKENSFEGNFNGVCLDDKKKLADMENDEDSQTNFCYSGKSGEFLGRSLSSAFKLVLYMISFCAILALFWGLCLWVFYQTLDNYVPKLQQDSSYIGRNPGLGFRPMRTATNPYSSLIWFTHGASGNWDYFKNDLDKFLNEYEPGYWANAGATQTKCDKRMEPLTEEEACEFNKEWLSDINSDYKCISEEKYGYLHGKPCILIKLNRVYGWNPRPYYDIDEVKSLTDMPDLLKGHIIKTWEDNCKGRANEKKCPELNMVWLHCDGENAPDKEAIGNVTYTPWRGFPGYFFPYFNQLGYLQPIVMVQLQNPTPAVLINIECTAWAKVETEEGKRIRLERRISDDRNEYGIESIHMEHDRTKMRGSIHIELLMD